MTSRSVILTSRSIRALDLAKIRKIEASRGFKGTLVIPSGFAAVAAAKIVDSNDVRLIILVRDDGTTLGFVWPKWTRSQLAKLH
jgi:hypothetical protein